MDAPVQASRTHHLPPGTPLPEGLPLLELAGRRVLPVVQGAMGVGVSASGLAGSVAAAGAVGTLSSVDLRRHHPDLMARTEDRDKDDPSLKADIDAANLEALDREVRAALERSGGHGLVAVNVMRALGEYEAYVRRACESGAHAIVVGAGLPLDLPEITADFPGVALVPIVSDARTISLILKKWKKRGRLPDAFVVEHPRLAGGHLGATRLEDLSDARFDFERVLPEARAIMRELGIDPARIPLIAAGGIDSNTRVRELVALGASAVQLGTAFAVTEESDAHPVFKRTLAGAGPEDIVEFISVAGLPARAVRTPWLEKYLRMEERLKARAKDRGRCVMAFDCLAQCGLRDGLPKFGQFCIDQHLAAALQGRLDTGLFFRGAGRVPFGERIRPVADLLRHLLDGRVPDVAAA